MNLPPTSHIHEERNQQIQKNTENTVLRQRVRESENQYEKPWSLVPLISSQQQVQVIRSVCDCAIVIRERIRSQRESENQHENTEGRMLAAQRETHTVVQPNGSDQVQHNK